MNKYCNRRPGGFTLLEVLVALAIIAIALLAALRAAGQGINDVEYLRERMLAGWVAKDLLAEQRARRQWLPLGIERGTRLQGGHEFAWRREVLATPNARFRRVNIRVFATSEEAHSIARLTGFAVNPPGAGN